MPPRCLALSGTLGTPIAFARSPQSLARTFTSTAAVLSNPLQRRKGGDLGSHLPKYVIPQDAAIPEYPYGAAQLFKQQNSGLYGGKSIQFGNNVSKKTETTTRRYWKPNVLNKALYSVGLKRKIKLRVTSNVIKTIDREGGLDEYLLKQSEARIKELGPLGWALRWTLLQRPSVVRRMRAQAAALGVPQEDIDAQWPEPPTEGLTPEDLEAFEESTREALEYLEHGNSLAAKELARTKWDVKVESGRIYKRAHRAAQNYLSREDVDTIEEGIKLAFLREDQRNESRALKYAMLKTRLEDKHGKPLDDPKELKRAIDKHHRDVSKEVAEIYGGNRAAYRKQAEPERATAYEAAVAEAGSEALLKAQHKAANLKEIIDSESALASESTPETERGRIASALERAQHIIDASSKADYIEQSLARWEQDNQDKWPLNSVSQDEGLGEASEEAVQVGNTQAWDALAQKAEVPQPRL